MSCCRQKYSSWLHRRCGPARLGFQLSGVFFSVFRFLTWENSAARSVLLISLPPHAFPCFSFEHLYRQLTLAPANKKQNTFLCCNCRRLVKVVAQWATQKICMPNVCRLRQSAAAATTMTNSSTAAATPSRPSTHVPHANWHKFHDKRNFNFSHKNARDMLSRTYPS